MEPDNAPSHADGGLLNVHGKSHVLVTVQALLHCAHFLEFLCSDAHHKNNCGIRDQCIICCLKNIYRDLCDKKLSDPAPLIAKWYSASCHMSPERQNSPLIVMTVFVNLIRLEYADAGYSSALDLDSSPVAKIWKYLVKTDVSCPSCGSVEEDQVKSVVEFKRKSLPNLQNAIVKTLFDSIEEVCPHCKKNQAQVNVKTVELPKCLIVHMENCTLQSQLPFELDIRGTKLSLKCLIVDPKGVQRSCFIITNCPDYKFRRFDDTQITLVSPQMLSTVDFYTNSSVMVLYETKVKKQVKINHKQIIKPNRGTHGMKILSYPDVSALPPPQPNSDMGDQENMVESQRTCNEGVQTESKCMIDRGVQTIPYYSYETCKCSPKFKFFTGLDVEDFITLFDLIGGHETISTLKRKYTGSTPKKIRPQKLTSEDKLFMFLLRLRRGLPLEELAEMFGIGHTLVHDVCYIMTRLLYLTFKSMEDDMFPTAAEQRKYKPQKMKHFKNLRILLDGLSIFIEAPSNFEQQGNTYSSYKGCNVIIFSVGISCNCATVFCSDGMEGSMSDKGVIVNSNLLSRLQKGDGVMTDRGYELTAELQEIGCEFYKPPTLGERRNFTKEEEILTKAIASARIYTEHAIADIKDNRLLKGVLPFKLLPVVDNLVYIAAYLRNFGSSRIHDKRFVVSDVQSETLDDPGQIHEGQGNDSVVKETEE